MVQLKGKETVLKEIFDKITYVSGNSHFFSSLYDRKLVEANIRKAFYTPAPFTCFVASSGVHLPENWHRKARRVLRRASK